MSDYENGRGRGSDRGHGSEFPHVHGRNVGGRAHRRGCARHGYAHDVHRAARHVNVNDRDWPRSEWWMIRGTWS